MEEFVKLLPRALIDLPASAPSISTPKDFRDGWFWAIVIALAVFWLSAYILAIHRGAVDKRVGMPVVVVPVNFAWEFVHSMIIEQEPAQRPANFIWFFIDIIILGQVLRYGNKDFPQLSKEKFRTIVFGIVGYTAIMFFLAAYEFRDELGMYSGVALNVLISISFIVTLRLRGSSAGQSLYIAICKWLGSVFAWLNVWIIFPSRTLIFFWFATICALDVLYIVLLHRQIRAEGQSPWAFNRPRVVERANPASGLAPHEAGHPKWPGGRADSWVAASHEGPPVTR